MKTLLAILLTTLFTLSTSIANTLDDRSEFVDKCGFDAWYAAHTLQALGHAWGYGYDTLLVDLQRWQQSPYATVDSIGASTQNRGIWLLTIADTMEAVTPPIRISIHARTHPGEVQSTWVTNEIIQILLGESQLARVLRANCVFNIVPMYNPDGVELGYPRENANGIDIESNWFVASPEQEVLVLRGLFEEFMATESPVEVALNMHSAYACKRYFVFHDAAGTSQAYENLEREYVGAVYNQWPEGIEPWNYMVTWTSGTPRRYPESWFWLNYGAAVMALTYEDGNCETAGDFDRTATAILAGTADYLGLQMDPASVAGSMQSIERLKNIIVYPNPMRGGESFHVFNPNNERLLFAQLFDIQGRAVHKLDFVNADRGRFQLPSLANGRYFLNFITDKRKTAVPITILK